MGEQYKSYYPGSATLDETCRACLVEVLDGEPKKLMSVEGVIHDQEEGVEQKLNEATFEKDDDPMAILTMLNDFVFVDVSTPQGASDAAAASKGSTNIGGPGAQFSIWIEGVLTPVQILGKHTE